MFRSSLSLVGALYALLSISTGNGSGQPTAVDHRISPSTDSAPAIPGRVLSITGEQRGEKHPFSPGDWGRARSAYAVAISPDGVWILYTVLHWADQGGLVTEWWAIHPDGTGAHPLELPADFDPRGFTADGRLFGSLRSRKGDNELAIFLFDSLSKASVPAVEIKLPSAPQSVTISPDGKRFAVLLDPRPADPLADVHTVVQAGESSLYVVNADGTRGKWWQPQLHNVGQAAWSPDSLAIALISSTPKIGYHFVKSWIDVCTESSVCRVVTFANFVGDLVWIDGGKSLAFLSTTSPTLTPDHLWTVPASGGKPIDRTPRIDGSVSGLSGGPHGKVWALINHGVYTAIETYADGRLSMAFRWPSGTLGTPTESPLSASSDQLAFSVTDPEHYPDLAVPTANGLRRITTESDDLVSKIALGPVKVVHWTSKEGVPLEGIATFPPHYVPGKRYPFVVLVHGGPEMNEQLHFDSFSRLITGAGYVALQPQYRGSTGYGTQFLNAIYQHFGDRSYRDVESATDFAVAQGWADPNRLAIYGWSAGGAMAAWAVTQTHRYRAAIDGAGITDWASFIWTSDAPQIDFDARWPDKNPDAFRRFSPVNFVENVTTPILILHGAADQRVPTYQSLEFFQTLAARGKVTRFVIYPGSGHIPGRWEQRQDVLREVLAWLKRYNP